MPTLNGQCSDLHDVPINTTVEIDASWKWPDGTERWTVVRVKSDKAGRFVYPLYPQDDTLAVVMSAQPAQIVIDYK